MDRPKSSDMTREHIDRYRQHTSAMLGEAPDDEALARAIGAASVDEFERFGRMEAALLVQSGLGSNDSLIDVGCGSGRLSVALAPWFRGGYVGVDIDPQLLDAAERITQRPDWAFEVVEGLTIPREEASADMVCFFSVLTHLRHEESYLYLREAVRVLRPGGRIVFSFLEFAVAAHWPVFEATLDALRRNTLLHVNQFISRDAVESWATNLGVTIEAYHPGSEPYIDLDLVPFGADGSPASHRHDSLGQSACVLSVPDPTR